MSTLLQAPKYFKLQETEPGTVLVRKGTLVKEDVSVRFGNRQFYFFDQDDRKLKCLSGGSLAYIIDLHELDKTKLVKITYAGMSKVENGKFAGKDSHQFEVELVGEESLDTQAIKSLDTQAFKDVQDKVSEPKMSNLDDLE